MLDKRSVKHFRNINFFNLSRTVSLGKFKIQSKNSWNTINFSKSMHYNPFEYLHSEKDILKLVTTLIANTKGDGKSNDDFWVKAETLLYCALIAGN